MTERMLSALSRLDLRLIAIDEAHCISKWGPAFRPEFEALSRLRETFPGVPIIALTATADEATRADISAQLFGGAVETILLGFDRPNIKLAVARQERGEAAIAVVPRPPPRPERHRLLPVAQEDRGDGGVPQRERPPRPAPIMRA